MSQGVLSIEGDGTVRIGGFWSAAYVMTDRRDPSWADPTTATTGSGHCWYDRMGDRSVSVQLAWKTYYR